MFFITELDTYRDGGTISIKGHFNPRININYNEICLDKRMGGKGDGKLWFGYPESEDSILIDDPELIKLIKEKVEEYKKYTNYRLDEILDALK